MSSLRQGHLHVKFTVSIVHLQFSNWLLLRRLSWKVEVEYVLTISLTQRWAGNKYLGGVCSSRSRWVHFRPLPDNPDHHRDAGVPLLLPLGRRRVRRQPRPPSRQVQRARTGALITEACSIHIYSLESGNEIQCKEHHFTFPKVLIERKLWF